MASTTCACSSKAICASCSSSSEGHAMSTATPIRAWAAQALNQPVVPFSYDPGPLGAEDVEIRVEHCGLCHSDLSVIDGEWGPAAHPVVGGVGRAAWGGRG